MARGPMFLRLVRASLFARLHRLVIAVSAIAIGSSVAAALLLVSFDVGRKVNRELQAFGPNLVLVGDGFSSPGAIRRETTSGREQVSEPSAGEPRLDARSSEWLAGERAAGRIAIATGVRYALGRAGDRMVVVAGVDNLDELEVLYPTWKMRAGFVPRGEGGGGSGRRGEQAPADARRPVEEALVGAQVARSLGQLPSELRVSLITDSGPRPLTLRVRNVFEAGGAEDGQIFVPRAVLAQALGLEGEAAGRYHLALARSSAPPSEVLAYADRPLPAALGGADLRAIKQLSSADGEVLRRLRVLLLTVTLVALVAAILSAMSTLYDLVLERTREIALLRSIGASRHEIVRMFLAEACVIGILGGAVGLAIGIAAAQAIGHGVFGSGIAVAPAVLPSVFALAVGAALVASVGPVLRALAIEPAGALRGD